MKVIRFPEIYKFKNATIILGGFELFHKGHEKLLEAAKKNNKCTIIIMVIEDFSKINHSSIAQISSLKIRLQQLANLEISGAILVDMNKQFIIQKGDDFISKIIKNYGVKKIICGKDFSYGQYAKQSSKDLVKQFKNTEVIDIYKVNKSKISSSIIKELIYYGKIDQANELLVCDWTSEGIVDHEWEFTQNENQIQPQPGIYIVNVEYKSVNYPGLIHINLKKKKRIYFVNSNDHLLGRTVYAHWHHKIRAIVKDAEDGVVKSDSLKTKEWFVKKIKEKNNNELHCD